MSIKKKPISNKKPKSSAEKFKWNSSIGKMIIALLISIGGFLIYSNTLNHGFALDDNSAIQKNWVVKQGVTSIPTIFTTSYRYGFWKGADELYRPIPLTVFAIVWDLSPNNPKLYHWMNVLLYAFTGSFLFLVLCKLFNQSGIIIPLIATLLFITHPIHTEVVANIKSMDEILSFLFVLSTIYFSYKYYQTHSVINIIGVFTMFTLALFSKESAITFIVIIPLTIYFFTNSSFKILFKLFLALIIPSVAFLLIREQVIVKYNENSILPFIDNVIYSAPDIFVQWATAFDLLLHYLGKVLSPITLSSDYSFSETSLSTWINPLSWLSLLIHAALISYAVVRIKSKNIISYGIFFYLISFSIYSNLFIVIGSAFGERFLFTPILGFCIIVAYLIKGVSNKIDEYLKNKSSTKNVSSKRLIILLMLVILIPYSIKTYARNKDWESSFTLYKADINNSPKSARLKYFYGNELRVRKANLTNSNDDKIRYLNESIEQYNSALEIYPNYKAAIGALGISYYRLGDKNQAYEYYNKAIEMGATDATTYNNMAVLFSETGNHSKALEYYQRAVLFDPYYFDAWKNLGNTYFALRNNEKSIQSFYEALKYEPNNADCNYWLALGLQQKGEIEEANKYFNKAFKLKPSLRSN